MMERGAALFVTLLGLVIVFVIAGILITNRKARPPAEYVRDGLGIIAALAAVLFGFYILAEVAAMGSTGTFDPIIVEHFRATVGLPLSAFAAFCIVIGLRASYGAIELEAVGFRLKGASGPIILWVVCFIAFVFAIWLLW